MQRFEKIKFYINLRDEKDFLDAGFIKNDSCLFKYLYIHKCGTKQNRIYVLPDYSLKFGNIDRNVLKIFYLLTYYGDIDYGS